MLLNFLGVTASQGAVPPPAFVSAATSTDGLTVTVTFSKAMADPSGKHAQFTVNDGATNAVTAAALNADTAKIDLTLTSAIDSGDTVTVAYTAGNVVSADTGILASFSAQSVTNNAVVLYQVWSNYLDSPDLTSTYPYQVCWISSGNKYIGESQTKWYKHSTYPFHMTAGPAVKYIEETGAWRYESAIDGGSSFGADADTKEANHPIYTDNTFSTIWFDQTTP